MIRKLVLALLCSIGVAQVYGQTISGTVLNERSEAIPYVKITVKSNNKPFLGDGKGFFQVSVTDPANEVLIFSAMGYQKQEVAVAGKTNLTVVLLEISQDTKDVVVVGYGTAKFIRGNIGIRTREKQFKSSTTAKFMLMIFKNDTGSRKTDFTPC